MRFLLELVMTDREPAATAEPLPGEAYDFGCDPDGNTIRTVAVVGVIARSNRLINGKQATELLNRYCLLTITNIFDMFICY
jgi:hypothetical protein